MHRLGWDLTVFLTFKCVVLLPRRMYFITARSLLFSAKGVTHSLPDSKLTNRKNSAWHRPCHFRVEGVEALSIVLAVLQFRAAAIPSRVSECDRSSNEHLMEPVIEADSVKGLYSLPPNVARLQLVAQAQFASIDPPCNLHWIAMLRNEASSH